MAGAGWPEIVAHRERLLRIAVRRCATREDAEDVVSEAMLRCATFENLDERRLEQFLTSVTVRLCADLHRRADRGARAVVRLLPDLDDTAPSPEDEVCEAVEAEVLNDLLASLPTRQRAVLTDRALGLSVTQIARRNALSYKAAESALSRARGTLRAALATAFGGVAVVVAGAWAVLRPRRAVVAALPVATLVLAGTGIRLPVGGSDESSAGRPRYGTAELGDLPERHPVPPRKALVAVARPAAERVDSRAPGPRESTPRRPMREVLAAGEGPVRVIVTEPEEDEDLPTQISRCLREGVWIEFHVEPNREPYRGERVCGPANN